MVWIPGYTWKASFLVLPARAIVAWVMSLSTAI
jgi:hypothetical protein